MRPAKTERGRGPGSIAPVNSLVIHSACIGGMIAPRFNDFLAQTRQNLDPDEEVILFYDRFASTSKSRHSCGEMRTRLLPDALQSGIGVTAAVKANKWFRFMQTYLPRCLNGKEIEG